MKWEIYIRKDGKHGIRLVGNNGEKVLQSEGYHSEGNARRAIKEVRRQVDAAPIVVSKDAASDEEPLR